MFETTTLAILSSLIIMSAKYDCQNIRSEIVQHLMLHYPDKLEDFDKEKMKPLFSEPSAENDFGLLSIAHMLHAPVLLSLMYYFCAIHPLELIFRSSVALTQSQKETIILSREKMSKFSYEAGIAALLPACAYRLHVTKGG